jgi:hypothetical protein
MSEHRVYCVSKARWAPMWRSLRDAHGIPMVSSWIDKGGEETIQDWGAFWAGAMEEASTATCALVYLAPSERLVGGLAEIGAVLSHGGEVYVYGAYETLRTLLGHPHVHHYADRESLRLCLPSPKPGPEQWLAAMADSLVKASDRQG